MTMTPARGREILASYGGDAARWPAAERAATIALIASDWALHAERVEAAALDMLLDSWAQRDLTSGTDAAEVAERVLRPAPGWRRWWAGGGIAAATAAAVVLMIPSTTAPDLRHGLTIAATTTLPDDDAAFASLFTPTPDEETII